MNPIPSKFAKPKSYPYPSWVDTSDKKYKVKLKQGQTYQEKAIANTRNWKNLPQNSKIRDNIMSVAKQYDMNPQDLYGMAMGEGLEKHLNKDMTDYSEEMKPSHVTFAEYNDINNPYVSYKGEQVRHVKSNITPKPNAIPYTSAQEQTYGIIKPKRETNDRQIPGYVKQWPSDLGKRYDVRTHSIINSPYVIDGYGIGGLDTINEKSVQRELSRNSYPKLNIKPREITNEKGIIRQSGLFKSPRDVLEAQAQLFNNEGRILNARTKRENISLTPTQKQFFTHMSFNTGRGNTKKVMSSLSKQGLLNDSTNLTNVTSDYWRDVMYNTMRRIKGSENIKF